MCGFATNCNTFEKSCFHDFSARPRTMSEGGSRLGDSLARNFTSKNVAKGSWGAESTYLPPGMLTRGRQDKGRVTERFQ